MADKKITELTNITGANLVDADEFVVVDISADETKAITLGELKEAFDSGSGFVRITGDTMTGDLALSGADVTFGDNDKAIFGAGSDLQIYHDGSNSYISDQGTGNIILDADDSFQVKRGANTSAVFDTNAEVTLYHNNSPKLATSATGIDVTGTVTADGLTVDGSGTAQITSTSGTTLELIRSGSAGQISSLVMKDGGNAQNRINSSGGALEFEYGPSNTNALKIDNNGDISFYEDTGTTPKFFWDASAESLGIGTSSTDGKLKISATSGGGNAAELTLYGNNGAAYGYGNVVRSKIASKSAGDAFGADLLFYTNDSSNVYQERMVIDSSGNVGIGTSSPSDNLDVASAAPTLRLTDTDGYYSQIYAGSGSLVFRTDVGQATAGDTMQFVLSGSEAMRIDSSGNLLVGTTSTDVVNNNGIVAASAGYLDVGRNDLVARFTRRSTDGDIISFRKDGTTVGSIGSNASAHLTMGSGDTGLLFNAATDKIHPWNMSTQGIRDNAVDLGVDVSRFKDLYLSGGVYLGGTGSANKLDDYEEGTFSPYFSGTGATGSFTYSLQVGYYEKVGNICHVRGYLYVSGVTSNYTGTLRLSGLPFNVASDINIYSAVTVGYTNSWATAAPQSGHSNPSTNTAALKYFGTNGNTVDITAGLAVDDALIFDITYRTA